MIPLTWLRPLTLGCALACACHPVAAVEGPRTMDVICPATGGPVTLDGAPTEAAWERAVTVGPLVLLQTGATPERNLTRARLLHDDKALYLAVTCQGKPGKAGHRGPRDEAQVWGHDHLEVFLDPTPDTDDYYHLVLDNEGCGLDSLRAPDTVTPRGPAWDGAWEGATAPTADGWSAELRVPFATLGVAGVAAGALWRIRLGRDGAADGPIMWPLNLSNRFHERGADAALYFGTDNLLANPGFETGKLSGGAPAPWQASLTSPEVNNQPQGEFSTVEGGIAPGHRALLFKKLPTALYWPQVWSEPHTLLPGATYEFALWLKGDMSSANLRANATAGAARVKLASPVKPTPEFARYSFTFVVPEKTPDVSVGLSAPAGVYGQLWCDEAVLRRVFTRPDTAVAAYAAPDWSPDPDPVHGLEALHERAGHKPWDLFERDGGLLTYRVMFRDRKYGTELWLLDNSPEREYVTTASIWPGWNQNGSVLLLAGERMLGKVTRRPWLANADFSRLTVMPAGGMPLWDLEHPDLFYRHSPGKLEKVNLRTGEQSVLATWEPRLRERSYGLTRDNKSVFVVDHDGGQWVRYTPGATPLPYVQVLDCYGMGPDGKENLPLLVLASEDAGGPLIRIIVGTRIDTATGRMERVIVPISGRREYLETFASGRVQFPTDATPPATRDLAELFRSYQLYPSCSHGHLSYSPDGEYTCWDGGPSVYRTRDGGDRHDVNISSNGWVYHTCWFRDPRFFVTCVRGYLTTYSRAHNASLLSQVFADGTWQPVCDIKMRPNAYYYGGNFATLSPDATKIHYESSMSGVARNYMAVLARPQAPRDVRWQAQGNSVVLSWSPPPHHRELRGTLIYRGLRSGDGYELLTPEPVTGTTYRDTTLSPGRAYYYVLTSLEHSGLESPASSEAARVGVGLPAQLADPLVIYREAEAALVDLGTGDRPGLSQGRDRLAASDWSYVFRTPDKPRGEGPLTVDVPARGSYQLFARVRSGDPNPARWELAIDGSAVGVAEARTPQWEWIAVGTTPLALAAGRHTLAMATADRYAQLDLVCLATDPAFRPQGARPEDSKAPAPPGALQVVAVRGRTVHLKWNPASEPDLAHYNVYASRGELAADQRFLLASPTYPEFVDWGLRAATAYRYGVTAVDRHGNESALSPVSVATTQPAENARVDLELRFDQARLEGPLTRGTAAGTHAESFVLLPDKATSEEMQAARATWQVELAHEGDYYLWLRYLPGGAAGSRAAAVVQNLSVLLDGKAVGSVGGGDTDLSVPDSAVRPELWTWARPVKTDLIAVKLPAGKHELRLERLAPGVRYDTLVVTNEPTFLPPDGRLRQR